MKHKKIISLLALALSLVLSGCAGYGGAQQNLDESLLPDDGQEIDTPAQDDGQESDPPVLKDGESAVETYWKSTTDHGITVSENGTLMLGEKPLYLAGVNCFNLFNRCLGTYDAQGAFRTLDVLKSNGVSVVRFDCGGYDHSYVGQYLANKEEYLRLLKEIAAYAQECKIGLIPSFFWLYHAVPDHYDEPIRYWGREGSKTLSFMEDYTASVTDALKEFRSLFAWEFGNEFNLSCDLPNVTEHLPALPPHSTRAKRTSEDYLSATDVTFAFERFASIVRAHDPYRRMITSGNASLRPSQYHQLHENSWAQDSEAEYAEMCKLFAPGEMDAICEHIYFTEQTTFGRDLELSEYLGVLLSMAKAAKKAFIVGEWGGGTSEDYKYYSDISNKFVDAGVQLALLWNFNLNEWETEYSFSAASARGKMLLQVVREANERFDREIYGE